VQKALPLFKDGGSIILNASVRKRNGCANLYRLRAASKAAVRSFARGWTMELKDPQDSCEFDESWPNRNSGFGERGPHR